MITVEEEKIIVQATAILTRQIKLQRLNDYWPTLLQLLLTLYGSKEREEFGCVFIDQIGRVIGHLPLFQGTATHCGVYPREVSRSALLMNAAGVILVHNHLNGLPPSTADIKTTELVKTSLLAVDINLIDHIVVSAGECISMLATGLINTGAATA